MTKITTQPAPKTPFGFNAFDVFRDGEKIGTVVDMDNVFVAWDANGNGGSTWESVEKAAADIATRAPY